MTVSRQPAGITLDAQSSAMVVLADCRLFDGERLHDEPSTVVVRGDEIVYAGPSASAPAVEERATVVPARELTAMPGLIDVHNHVASEADMLAYARCGVTTVRLVGRELSSLRALRTWAADAAEPVPRILSCGPFLDEPPTAYPEWTLLLTSPEQARALAERLIAEEQLDGLVVTQRARAPFVRALADVAGERGLPLVGQTWLLDGAEAARAGVRQLENTSRIVASPDWPLERLLRYDSVADRLAMWAHVWANLDWYATMTVLDEMVEANVAYAPTMVAHYLKSDLGQRDLEADPQYRLLFSEADRATPDAFLRYLNRSWSEDTKVAMRASLSNREEWLRRFHAAGGTIAVGTDTHFGGLMLHAELRNLEEVGLGAAAAVRAATSDAADTIGRRDLGRLRAGCRADVVLVAGRPLERVADCRRIRALLCRGRLTLFEGAE